MPRVLLLVLLISLPLMARADVYRWVDADGHVQYSDVPTPGAQRIAGAPSGSTTASGNTTAGSSADDKSGSLQKRSQQISSRLAAEAAARAVQKDTAEAHAAQCKQAQDDYQKLIQARRLYKTGADGERTYLSDAEIDQQRLTAHQAMETACQDQGP